MNTTIWWVRDVISAAFQTFGMWCAFFGAIMLALLTFAALPNTSPTAFPEQFFGAAYLIASVMTMGFITFWHGDLMNRLPSTRNLRFRMEGYSERYWRREAGVIPCVVRDVQA